MDILQSLNQLLSRTALLTALTCVGVTIWFPTSFRKMPHAGDFMNGNRGNVGIDHGLCRWQVNRGKNGLADIPIFAGLGFLGGSMLRDMLSYRPLSVFALQTCGTLAGSVWYPFWWGLCSRSLREYFTAIVCGYRDASSITTIGAGAMTYIVGPVTGTAIGASSEVIALSIAAGLIKAICVMMATPILAKSIGLDNPRSAMIYGGTWGPMWG